MNAKKISELFNRLGRLSAATKEKAGPETAWTYTSPDGETQRYVVRGLKSHAQMEDNIFTLIGWIWNAEDYLKAWAKKNGKDQRQLDKEMHEDSDLSVCSKLANGLKHGDFDTYHFGAMSFTVPQGSVKRITLLAQQVELDVENPENVEYRLPVLNESDNTVGDALEYAERAIAALEHFRSKIEEPNR
jgi:hypothetical protein